MLVTLLADAAIKGGVLLLVLFALAGLLRRAPAAVRHLYWSVGLIGFVLLPVLSLTIPWQIAVLPGIEAAQVAPVEDGVLTFPASKDESRVRKTSLTDRAATTGRGSEGAARSGEVWGASGGSLPGGFELPGLAALAMMLWVAGVLAVMGRLLVGIGVTSLMARRGRELTEPDCRRSIQEARRRLGIAVPVRLVASRRARMPFGAGIVRPVVVVPESAEGWSEERRVAVLLHELAHFRRGDIITHYIAQVACAIHWFNPLVWLAARRLRAESERACDDLVLTAGTRASEYAGHLIEIVRDAGRAWTPAAALPMARRSEFEGRLLAILEPGAKRHGLTPATVLLIVLAVVVSAVPLAAMGPAQAADSQRGPAVAELRKGDDGTSSSQQAQGVDRSFRVAALLGVLDDEDMEVRRAAVTSLGNLQDTTAVRALMRALRQDSDPEVRQAAAWSLGEIEDPRAIPALGEALRQDDVAAVRMTAAHALGEIEDPRGVEPLGAAINDSDIEVRRAVIHALGEIESPAAIDVLVPALRDSDPEIRETAVWALGEIEDARAVPALSDVLRSDASAVVREKAAWALGEIEHGSAVEALSAALSDRDVKVRRMAIWALGEVEDARAVEPLAGLLRDDDAEVRRYAAHALGNIEDRRAVEPLMGALGDSDAQVREMAAWALGEIEHPSAAPGLARALGDSEAAVRRKAAWALGELDVRSAPPALIEALRDEDPEVRRIAAHSLGEIEDPAAVAGLAELVKGADVEAARVAIWALSEIDDPAAYRVLVEALDHQDPEIRRAAARAMGQGEH